MSFLNPKKPVLQLITIGVCAFLYFLITSAPASLLTQQISSHLPVNFSDVKGTVWNGTAETVFYRDTILGSLNWSIPVYQLITGKIGTDINISSSEFNLKGRISYGLGSKLDVQNTQVSAQTAFLGKLLQFPLEAKGQLKADIQYLNWQITTAKPEETKKQRPPDKVSLPDREKPQRPTQERKPAPRAAAENLNLPQINAKLGWENVSLPAFNIDNLGSYSITIKSIPEKNPGSILANVAESKGRLEIGGNASLDINGHYRTSLNVKPSDDAPEMLKNGLSMLGRPDNENRYQIKREGKIEDLLAFF